MDQPKPGVQHWPTAFSQRAVISPFDGEQLNHKDVRLMTDEQESRVNGLSIGKVIRIHIPLIIGILHSAEHQQHRTDRKVKSFYELERSIFDF